MKPDTWMPFYIGDYTRDTIGLSLAEHGAYLLTIFAYWTKGGPLTEKEARRSAGRLACKVEKYFDVSGGTWKHKRIDEELAKARGFREKQRHAAAMRWHSQRKARGIPGECPSPSHTNNRGAAAALTAPPAPCLTAEQQAENRRRNAEALKRIRQLPDP